MAKVDRETVGTYELNLILQVGGFLFFRTSEPVAMAFARVEKRTDTGISLPAFICWLNCNGVQNEERSENFRQFGY